MQENAAKPLSGDASASLQQQLQTLLRTHHGNLLNQIAKLGDMISHLDAPGYEGVARVREAEALAHQIKGAGGSIGFSDISRAATTLDDELKLLVKQGTPVTPDQFQATLGLYKSLQDIAKTTTPESSTLYNADLSRA